MGMGMSGNLSSSYHSDFYEENYHQIVYTGVVGRVHSKVHQAIEKNFDCQDDLDNVLEVGAGSFEHIKYVRHKYSRYFGVDLNAPSSMDWKLDERVQFLEMNAEDLVGIDDVTYDRVIATCLLAHLINPEIALNEWRRVAKVGGYLTIYIPCEPGLLLRIARQVSTARKSKKMGVNHLRQHYKQHRNYYLALMELIKEVFEQDELRVRRFPFRFFSWNFNLFVTVEVKKK